MSDLTFVQGDTGPDLLAILHDQDDSTSPIDLTDATQVLLQMREVNDRRYMVNAPVTILDAPAGSIKYSWGANDLARAGDYEIQFEVTYNGGMVQTTAVPNRITVRRQ